MATIPVLWSIGQRMKAAQLNLMVTAIQELQALPTAFNQTVTGMTWASTSAQNKTLSAVPTGVPVMGAATVTVRLGASYCVIQLFDGATKIGGDLPVTIPGGSSSCITVVTVPFAATFTNTPVLRFTLASSTSSTVDNFGVTGLRFR